MRLTLKVKFSKRGDGTIRAEALNEGFTGFSGGGESKFQAIQALFEGAETLINLYIDADQPIPNLGKIEDLKDLIICYEVAEDRTNQNPD